MAAVPLVAGTPSFFSVESDAKDRRRRTKDRHNDRQKRRNKQKKRNRKKKETERDRQRRQNIRERQRRRKARCVPEALAVACAGKCATVTNNCGQAVDCGPCDCGVCPQCTQCNPNTGVCDPAFEGQTCDDGNACTQTDTCQNGVCVGSNPVVCTALDQCHDPGACDPLTGLCSTPNKANGSSCNDGNLCTTNDTCQGGICTPGPEVSCEDGYSCENGVCVCDPDKCEECCSENVCDSCPPSGDG